MSLSSHHQRILTALFLLPLLTFLIVKGGYFLLLGVIGVSSLGLWEFYGLFWGDSLLSLKCLGMLAGAMILSFFFIHQEHALFWILIGLFWSANMTFLLLYHRKNGEIEYGQIMVLLSGQFYLPMLLQFFLVTSPLEIGFVLLCTFATDTLAYYSGVYFGKKKIWPAISPKKTWMGSFGGLAGCLAVSLIMGGLLGKSSWPIWILVGVVLNIAAQFGDFFESALKRSLNIKDSGKLLPGHGGILDRIDSVLMVLPAYIVLRTFLPLF